MTTIKIIIAIIVGCLWWLAGFLLMIGVSEIFAEIGVFVLLAIVAAAFWFAGLWLHKKFKLGHWKCWVVAICTLASAAIMLEYEPIFVFVAGLMIVVFYVVLGVKFKLDKRREAYVPHAAPYAQPFLSPGPVSTASPSGIALKGRAYLQRMDNILHAIGDDQYRTQIIHLRKISGQILDYIAANPGQEHKLDVFIEYYFPKTVRLLEEYVTLSRAPVKSSNMRETIKRIAATISNMTRVFEHCLDNLYSDRIMNIDTDIAVLEKMMNLEGME